jgi:hypothetical protein
MIFGSLRIVRSSQNLKFRGTGVMGLSYLPDRPPPPPGMRAQCCSIEVTTKSASIIASSLANAGVCPLTREPCLSPKIVKSTLSLMLSCGMSDYSGEWFVSVGLPAKSGVAGLIFVVIPNVSAV